MDTDTLRQDAHCLLVFVSAIILFIAGLQAAAVAPDALRSLSLLNLGMFMSDIGATLALTFLALATGLGALVTSSRFSMSGVEIVPDARWRRIWNHDMERAA